MPKNRIQFQIGLGLARFLQDDGTEPQCEQALLPRALARRPLLLSLLAGTLFQATKLPLTTWFLAMFLLSQTKNGIAALELGSQLGVNDNTTWLLKHKLM